jgi:head-tail adaptor
MEAGRLRHWLRFERLEQVNDSDGNLVEEWLDAFEVGSVMPCELVALSGRELIAAQAVQSRVSHRIRCRYRPGFNAAQRAVDVATGDAFNIEALLPDPDSRIRWVTMLCYVGANAGGTGTP